MIETKIRVFQQNRRLADIADRESGGRDVILSVRYKRPSVAARPAPARVKLPSGLRSGNVVTITDDKRRKLGVGLEV